MYKLVRNALLAAGSIALCASSAIAQTTDPRDFEGTWVRSGGSPNDNYLLGIDLPYKPEAQNLMADHLQWAKEGRAKASAHMTCRPTGVQGITAPKLAMLFLQTPRTTYMISQEDREVRRIAMQRPHLASIVPSYSGDSIGHWDGNTLVVDTVGYNGKGQLDEVGNPHSDKLHVVERWTKSTDGKMLTAEFTFSDPTYYTAPFTKTRQYEYTKDARIADYDCADNPREDDFANLTFENDWFKPTCVRPSTGDASGPVVCDRRPAPAKR